MPQNDYSASSSYSTLSIKSNVFATRIEESGMYYNYFRTYDSLTGRYIQSDPAGLNGGLNSYTYANGNPTSLVDPEGLAVQCLPGVAWGALAGGVGGVVAGGGVKGVLAGGAAGALVGCLNPFGANAAAQTAIQVVVRSGGNAAAASYAGQAGSKFISDQDVFNSDYDHGAAAGAAVGGGLIGPVRHIIVWRVMPSVPMAERSFRIIKESHKASKVANQGPGQVLGSVVDGAVTGAGELAGSELWRAVEEEMNDNACYAD